ncbi:uncharacterized protein LOC117168173 isoform X2 [Belonocnema kinseyi]|uniref:uncharacterized protein LOC117168173 isoform X2 n=1 Tax=Belonocnema kinseyi TaxID=2817044 RepID=UPI00143D143D|nr:uncharacterized protein LOC117168173 isoform X2 [Belonocnema kinseyi]
MDSFNGNKNTNLMISMTLRAKKSKAQMRADERYYENIRLDLTADMIKLKEGATQRKKSTQDPNSQDTRIKKVKKISRIIATDDEDDDGFIPSSQTVEEKNNLKQQKLRKAVQELLKDLEEKEEKIKMEEKRTKKRVDYLKKVQKVRDLQTEILFLQSHDFYQDREVKERYEKKKVKQET